MGIKLGDICKFQSGGTPARGNTEYFNGNIPWITTTALNGNNIGEAAAVEWITEKAIKESAAKIVPAFSIMVGTRVGVGKVAINTVDMSTSQDIISLIGIDESIWNKDFLCKFLQGKSKYLNSQARGATIKGIKIDVLSSLELPDISLEKQRHISSIIDATKKIISSRQYEIQKLDELIKARFVELFGHQSHNEKSLPYMTIDDVAEIYLGITHTPTYVDSGVMFISAKNTSGDFLDLSDVKYISREEFEGAPKGSKPQVNDVLFSRVGSNLGHPVILEEELELCTFVSLGFLRSKGNVTSNYLKHWMRDEFFAKQVSEHVKGGGQPNLNTGWLKEFKIIVPDLEEQKMFDDFCKQVDKSKVIEIYAMRRLKYSLMPGLMVA
ncbi:MAG: restriction endonuclease subunit S [Lachnospiraceae bacterium]|nr:restriction endonuclease subunit S [Lachnospiraceae bacterium]